jgi:hypothetical protein
MSKKYDSKNLVGDAGEHLVASFFLSRLGCIYRKQPEADIGIDGEIEILKNDGESTGKIIKTQVKSKKYLKLPKVEYIESRDYDYWRLLSLPVIVLLVDVDKNKIYWKRAEDLKKASKNYKVEFTLSDELTEADLEQFDTISREIGFDILEGLGQFVLTKMASFNELQAHPMHAGAFMNSEETQNQFEIVRDLVESLRTLAKFFPDLKTERSENIVNKIDEAYSDFGRVISLLGRRSEDYD